MGLRKYGGLLVTDEVGDCLHELQMHQAAALKGEIGKADPALKGQDVSLSLLQLGRPAVDGRQPSPSRGMAAPPAKAVI